MEGLIDRRDLYLGSDRTASPPSLAKPLRRICCDSVPDLSDGMKLQQKYFKSLGELETPAADRIFADPSSSKATKEWELRFKAAKFRLKPKPELHQPSHTVVMEAAMSLGVDRRGGSTLPQSQLLLRVVHPPTLGFGVLLLL